MAELFEQNFKFVACHSFKLSAPISPLALDIAKSPSFNISKQIQTEGTEKVASHLAACTKNEVLCGFAIANC